jgi:hypothetical protein
MTKQSRSILGVILAIVLALSAFGGTALGAPPQNDGLTTDEWTTDGTTYTPVFDVTVIPNQAVTVTFRAVPTIIYTDTPSGYATSVEAEEVEWAFIGTAWGAAITGEAAVQAQNYNAPDGFYASQATISIPYGIINSDIQVQAQNGDNYAIFTIHVANNATYTQNAISEAPGVAGQFTVAFNLDTPSTSVGGSYFDVNLFPVTLGTPSDPSTVYYVVDVLVAIMQQYPQLEFLDSSRNPIMSGDSYFNGVSVTSGEIKYYFEPDYSYSYYNGWMFRINDKFTMLDPANYPAGWNPNTDGPVGAAINQAYVQPGDVVDIYFANADIDTTATLYTRFESAVYNVGAGDITAQITASDAYYDLNNNFWWTVGPFTPLANTQVYIQLDSGAYTSYTTNANGYITVPAGSPASGTHTLTLRPEFISGTVIPERTSGYIEFVVS